MGNAYAEANGVDCSGCNFRLPPNSGNFENTNCWYIFFNKGNDNVKRYIYARKQNTD